eukprot:TRINITY_DN61297_c0_g1_i1.p1 TRINITY_DN61297_c0_g1~~TRINITY_DN61297_c0_g1_i1.p1  ORF type:complete len:870 (+),score=177.94 TRINITY_DN61297_c0_g1_i1:44-2611(+)
MADINQRDDDDDGEMGLSIVPKQERPQTLAIAQEPKYQREFAGYGNRHHMAMSNLEYFLMQERDQLNKPPPQYPTYNPDADAEARRLAEERRKVEEQRRRMEEDARRRAEEEERERQRRADEEARRAAEEKRRQEELERLARQKAEADMAERRREDELQRLRREQERLEREAAEARRQQYDMQQQEALTKRQLEEERRRLEEEKRKEEEERRKLQEAERELNRLRQEQERLVQESERLARARETEKASLQQKLDEEHRTAEERARAEARARHELEEEKRKEAIERQKLAELQNELGRINHEKVKLANDALHERETLQQRILAEQKAADEKAKWLGEERARRLQIEKELDGVASRYQDDARARENRLRELERQLEEERHKRREAELKAAQQERERVEAEAKAFRDSSALKDEIHSLEAGKDDALRKAIEDQIQLEQRRMFETNEQLRKAAGELEQLREEKLRAERQETERERRIRIAKDVEQRKIREEVERRKRERDEAQIREATERKLRIEAERQAEDNLERYKRLMEEEDAKRHALEQQNRHNSQWVDHLEKQAAHQRWENEQHQMQEMMHRQWWMEEAARQKDVTLGLLQERDMAYQRQYNNPQQQYQQQQQPPRYIPHPPQGPPPSEQFQGALAYPPPPPPQQHQAALSSSQQYNNYQQQQQTPVSSSQQQLVAYDSNTERVQWEHSMDSLRRKDAYLWWTYWQKDSDWQQHQQAVSLSLQHQRAVQFTRMADWERFKPLTMPLGILVHLKKIFQELDPQNTGHWNLEQLGNFIQRMGQKAVPYDQLKAMLKQVDVNQNGYIEFWEFAAIQMYLILGLAAHSIDLDNFIEFINQPWSTQTMQSNTTVLYISN